MRRKSAIEKVISEIFEILNFLVKISSNVTELMKESLTLTETQTRLSAVCIHFHFCLLIEFGRNSISSVYCAQCVYITAFGGFKCLFSDSRFYTFPPRVEWKSQSFVIAFLESFKSKNLCYRLRKPFNKRKLPFLIKDLLTQT